MFSKVSNVFGWLKLVFWQSLEDKICEGTNLLIQIEKIYWRLKAIEFQGSFGGNSDYHFEDVIHVQHCWSSPGIFFKEEIQRHEGFQSLRLTNHELSLNIKQKSSSGTIDMFFSLIIIISLLGFIGITESHLVDAMIPWGHWLHPAPCPYPFQDGFKQVLQDCEFLKATTAWKLRDAVG